MHVISRKKLLEAAQEHAELDAPLGAWYRIAKKASWKNLMEVRRQLPTADAAGEFTVFNIKGNAYRLITEINYGTGRVFLRYVLTHAEYSKGTWKK
ncbi:MAG TPA: type II toxin-antitoxin system HigB family toxin [Candidatus Acidoferrum sp.]|nr:type II toxin-antitoxin system HigB family toxin [Candidatus Acidoferrum sp.]